VNWHHLAESRRLGQYARLFITRKDAYGLVSYLQPSDLGQDLLETSAPFRRGFLLTQFPGNLCARGPLFLRPRSLPLLALISLAPAGLYLMPWEPAGCVLPPAFSLLTVYPLPTRSSATAIA
jgi:hypothetical protein